MTVNSNSMSAHSRWMDYNANNTANVNTNGYNASRTTIENNQGSVRANASKTGSETNLSKELTEQIEIEKGFSANVPAIKAKDDMLGSLLDMKA